MASRATNIYCLLIPGTVPATSESAAFARVPLLVDNFLCHRPNGLPMCASRTILLQHRGPDFPSTAWLIPLLGSVNQTASFLSMSDDDDDYMSSAFLNVTEDVRPGLVHSRQVKRKHEIEKKRLESNKLHKTKSRRELEEESRSFGMENAISSDNKGFAMLQRMGYKPGMKLGPQKESATNSGLSEPIKIKLKTDRGGLGREEEIRKRISEREERKSKIKVYKEKETERLTEEFRERMRNKTFMKYLMSDLRKSQKVCQQLDAENDVAEPMRTWFWYSVERDEEEEDDEEEQYDEDEEEDEIEPHEQLSFILDYLRTKYLYCLWCGIKYETSDDMDSNCPGTEKSDHDDDL